MKHNERQTRMKIMASSVIFKLKVKDAHWTFCNTFLTRLKTDTYTHIIGTNLLTKFHEDRKINEASGVLTRKNAPPPGSDGYQPTGIIFELVQDIIGMNLVTKFHEERTVNVASRVLTRFYYSYIRKNAPPLGSHFTYLLTKFDEDWTIVVASRENAPPLNQTIFERIQDIIGPNLLTKFHDDRKINVTSRVLTRKKAPSSWWPYIIGMNLLTEFHEDHTINVVSRVKNAPLLDSHVFQANIINVASRPYTENAPSSGSHIFKPTGIIFESVQDIIGMNLLTKFHEDWKINVASRVTNAPPLGSHVFQANVTIFELIQDITETNLLISDFMKIGQ
ncbi:hypothetical protein DPMN_190717 [Dreissena polymorpha]|uniref:Uncharacterized protein n=1 Tax=Dreissena polymorpha TaxID=45954 RepID=A0A9D3XXW2_DREPO|nr:hypothetical protein DPMN_190717 [Dreissena polymorpha]